VPPQIIKTGIAIALPYTDAASSKPPALSSLSKFIVFLTQQLIHQQKLIHNHLKTSKLVWAFRFSHSLTTEIE